MHADGEDDLEPAELAWLDRLLDGGADAEPPPGCARLASLLLAARATTPGDDLRAEAIVRAAFRSTASRRTSPTRRRPATVLVTVASIGAASLLGTAASAGRLPDDVQDMTSELLDRIGIHVPMADRSSPTSPAAHRTDADPLPRADEAIDRRTATRPDTVSDGASPERSGQHVPERSPRGPAGSPPAAAGPAEPEPAVDAAMPADPASDGEVLAPRRPPGTDPVPATVDSPPAQSVASPDASPPPDDLAGSTAAEPVVPAPSAEALGPGTPAEPAAPATAPEPGEPGTPAQPAVPATPANLVDPVDLATPANLVDLVRPTGPSARAGSARPVTPAPPEHPTAPATPVGPATQGPAAATAGRAAARFGSSPPPLGTDVPANGGGAADPPVRPSRAAPGAPHPANGEQLREP